MVAQAQIRAGQYVNIKTAATTPVKSGTGILRRIVVNASIASTITVYDSTTGSGNTIATIAASAPIGSISFDLLFGRGLTIVTAGASDLTVVYE